ncbi:unnamed protein product [Parnassius apollo]|uniref:(apollo) hypothetical protein n=1 Tax=Parnassius apollo TaxID=110799 RepID=A0A8S3WDN1_PARAO|nr:unnamed protein product [Parnassius apollo]
MTTRTSSPVPSTSSSITNEPAKTENNFMELSESAIYDDTGITGFMEQRYATPKSIIKQKLSEKNNIALTSDILTLTNSTRSFIVVTAHFLNTE